MCNWLINAFLCTAGPGHSYLVSAATTPNIWTPELETFQPRVSAQLLLLDMAVASSLPDIPHRWNARYGAQFPTITGPAGTTFGSCTPQSSVTPDLGTFCPRVWPHRWVQQTGEFVPLVVTPTGGNPCRACQNNPCGGMLQEKSCKFAPTDPVELQILGTFSPRVRPPGALEVKLVIPFHA